MKVDEQRLKTWAHGVLTGISELPENQREEMFRSALIEESTKLSAMHEKTVSLRLESLEDRGDRLIGVITHNMFEGTDTHMPVVKFLAPLTGSTENRLDKIVQGWREFVASSLMNPPVCPEDDSAEARKAIDDWRNFIRAGELAGPPDSESSARRDSIFEFKASVRKTQTATDEGVLKTKATMEGYTDHSWNALSGFGTDVRVSFEVTGGDADVFFRAGHTYKVTIERL